MTGEVVFITGGVRSGKSAYAERYVASRKRERAIYVATGVAFDQEMKQRIARHQKDRERQPLQWQTVEAPVTLPKLEGESAVVLMECVTTWLSNVLYTTAAKTHIVAIQQFLAQLQQWRAHGHVVVVVSNEVLDEPPSVYEETEHYRRLLGELHQQIVALSDAAFEVDCSIITRWK